MLKYKGYVGSVTFDDEAMLFHGEVVGLRDVITFQGTTPNEIEKEFKASVDGYLKFCKELSQEPEHPYSGNIHIRLEPETHAKIWARARMQGISLNNFINQTLKAI